MFAKHPEIARRWAKEEEVTVAPKRKKPYVNEAAAAVRSAAAPESASPEWRARKKPSPKPAADGGERGDHGRPSAAYETRKRREDEAARLRKLQAKRGY